MMFNSLAQCPSIPIIIETQEDIFLAGVAEAREKTLDLNGILTHEETWS